MTPAERAVAYRADARARYQAGISAIDQMTNRDLPSDVIRAGAELAIANFLGANLAMALAMAAETEPEADNDAAG